MSERTAEDKARAILDRMGVEEPESFTAGDLVELANLVAERDALRARVREQSKALKLAATRMGILVGQMRVCHEETGNHELLVEGELFLSELELAASSGQEEP